MTGLGNNFFSIMLFCFLLLTFTFTNEAAYVPFGPKRIIPKFANEIELEDRRYHTSSPLYLADPSQTTFNGQRLETPSPRAYVSTPPIPIKHTKESFERAQREWFEREINRNHDDDYYDSDNFSYAKKTSDTESSDSSSDDELLFQMSYEPKLSELLRREKEERKMQRELKKKAKKEQKELLKKKAFVIVEDENTGNQNLVDQDFIAVEELEENYDDLIKRRAKERFTQRQERNPDPSYDIENDSDFGDGAGHGSWKSFSF